MYSIELTRDWLLADKNMTDSACNLIPTGKSINLPFDVLPVFDRSFNTESSVQSVNSFSTVILYKALPVLEKQNRIYLDVWGVGGVAEFFINGLFVGRTADSGHYLFDITDKLAYDKKSVKTESTNKPASKGADKPLYENVLKCVACTGSAVGRYTGLGLGGASLLISASPVYIEPKDVYIATTEIAEKALLTVSVKVNNTSNELKTILLRAEAFSKKGKRVIKKQRKVSIKANSDKVFEINFKMSRHNDWSDLNPYLYGLKVSALESVDEEIRELDSHSESFGIRTFNFKDNRLRLNNQSVKLKGAVMAHDNGMLGASSELSAELYKLRRIKELGFNAVRYIGCPSDNALKAMDTLGLMCVVDIFDTFGQGRFMNDGHANFERDCFDTVKRTVQAVRNHPSVVIYNAVNDAPESYGRGAGYDALEKVTGFIKSFDLHRPVTANAVERPLLKSEAESFGIRCVSDFHIHKVFNEKNIFRTLTDKFFEKVDFASYGGLHKRFALDKDRAVLGLASSVNDLSEAFEETDKNANVLGNFVKYGADFIGNTADGALNNVSPNQASLSQGIDGSPNGGLLDKTYNPKQAAIFAKTVLSKEFVSSIWVMNPAELEENPEAEPVFEKMHSSWDWSQYEGKPIKVRVYSNAEVVSLKLNGNVISRKLAGKLNKYFAEFKFNYHAGKLEATGFYKGEEVTKSVLETTDAPRILRLTPSVKILRENDLCFIDISVADKTGRLIHHNALRYATVTVEGDGELVGTMNGDDNSFSLFFENTQNLFNGKMTAVVRALRTGKIVVKVKSVGLLSNKMRLRVK